MENKRAANFTYEEEQLLVALVEKYKSIIECKKSGYTTWTEKEKCWKLVEQQFNSQSGRVYRHAKTLKEKYTNLKKKLKLKYSVNRLNVLKTGGGTYKLPDVSDIDETIKGMIGTQVEGLSNQYDSDAVVVAGTGTKGDVNIVACPSTSKAELSEDYQDEEAEYTTLSNIPQKDLENYEILEDSNADCFEPDWSSYTSKNLKRPASSKLRFKNSSSTKITNRYKKYSGINHQLIEEKLEFVRLQKKKFLEEHSLRMELLKKKIELADKKIAAYNK